MNKTGITLVSTNQSGTHFHMDEEYQKHSLSQQEIGGVVRDRLIKFALTNFHEPDELSAVDLACGPWNLTIQLDEALKKNFATTIINFTGLDYSAHNIKHLIENSGNTITGITGSFYDPIKECDKNIVTSNEGLHRQPPYEMSEIIYSQLPWDEKEKYETWALENFLKALTNIYKSLKEGWIAVLQFGHEGQLQKLWELIRDVLNEKQFLKYKSQVNFPLYYPTEENIHNSLRNAGFKDQDIKIEIFNQDLKEDTPESITKFLEAFTRPGFGTFFEPEDLNTFYIEIEKKLQNMDINEFRKDQRHRTLIQAKKVS